MYEPQEFGRLAPGLPHPGSKSSYGNLSQCPLRYSVRELVTDAYLTWVQMYVHIKYHSDGTKIVRSNNTVLRWKKNNCLALSCSIPLFKLWLGLIPITPNMGCTKFMLWLTVPYHGLQSPEVKQPCCKLLTHLSI